MPQVEDWASAVSSAVACLALGLICRRLRFRFPLLAMAIFAFLPLQLRYATEARPFNRALPCRTCVVRQRLLYEVAPQEIWVTPADYTPCVWHVLSGQKTWLGCFSIKEQGFGQRWRWSIQRTPQQISAILGNSAVRVNGPQFGVRTCTFVTELGHTTVGRDDSEPTRQGNVEFREKETYYEQR